MHTVKGFDIVNKAEIDVFLELSCFFDDPEDVGNLISGSSAFSKTSLNMWKFGMKIDVFLFTAEFSKFADISGYKINIQKQFMFPYTNMEWFKKKINLTYNNMK